MDMGLHYAGMLGNKLPYVNNFPNLYWSDLCEIMLISFRSVKQGKYIDRNKRQRS